MKHLNTILLFFTISVTAFAQTPDSLTFQFSDLTLRQALQEISTKTGVQFIFSDALIDGKSVNGCYVGASIDSALHHLLTDTQIAFRHIKNGRIVLHPSDQRIIKGYVYDAENGQGLPFANITLKGTDHGTAANDQGYFALANYITDPCTLSVSYIGYQPGEVIADVQGGTSPVSVPLANDPIMTRELTVTGKKTPLLELQGSPGYIRFAPEQMEAIPSTGSNELHRAIQFMPGVSGIQEKPEGLYVMGGTPDQNLVLLDGMPIYKSTHFFGLVSAFHPDAIDSVELHLSGYPAQYGGHLSSVMQYHVDSAIGKPLKLGAGVDFMQMYAHARVPVSDKIGVTLAARRSYIDFSKPKSYGKLYAFMTKNSQSYISPTYTYHDINTKLQYKPDTFTNFELSGYYSRDYVDRNDTYGSYYSNSNYNKWYNKALGFKIDKKLFPIFNSRFTASYSELQSNFKRIDPFPFGFSYDLGGLFFENTNHWVYYNLKLDNSLALTPNSIIHIGLERQNHELDFSHTRMYEIDPSYYNINSNTGSYDTEEIQTMVNGYVHTEFQLKSLNLEPGFRINRLEQNKEYSTEPRFTANFKWNNLNLFAHWGHYHQYTFEKYGEIYFNDNTPWWNFSQSPSFSVNRSGGVKYTSTLFNIELEGYHKSFHNLNISVADEGMFMTGSGSSRGIIASLSFNWKTYKTWCSYHWSDSDYKVPNFNEDLSFPLFFHRKHELKMMVQTTHRGWDWTISGILASGQPFTPIISYYSIKDLSNFDITGIQQGTINSARMGDYSRCDVKLSRQFKNKFHMDWTTGIVWLNFLEDDNLWRYDSYQAYYSWQEKKDMLSYVFLFFIQAEFNGKDSQ